MAESKGNELVNALRACKRELENWLVWASPTGGTGFRVPQREKSQGAIALASTALSRPAPLPEGPETVTIPYNPEGSGRVMLEWDDGWKVVPALPEGEAELDLHDGSVVSDLILAAIEIRINLAANAYTPEHTESKRALAARLDQHSLDALRSRLRAPVEPGEAMVRFISLIRAHGYDLSYQTCDEERVPRGSKSCGGLWVTPTGELIVADGSPHELPDDHPLVHNCDEMGCSSVSHVIARLPAAPTEPKGDERP